MNEKAGARSLVNEHYRKANLRFGFKGTGLENKRTLDTLFDYGLERPEPLLFMSEAEIKAIPGISKVAFAEIIAYRDKYLPRTR